MADMANLADARPGSFRLENADSNLPPPRHVVQATREAVGKDRHNSYLPELRRAIARRSRADHGLSYDPERKVVVNVRSGRSDAKLPPFVG